MSSIDTEQVHYRANMLTGIAKQWDRTLFRTDDTGGSTRATLRCLTQCSAEYAHPLLALDDIQALMETLRDALHALGAYRDQGISPIDDEDLAVWSDNMIIARLEDDIDQALWPLLTGLSTVWACRECQRTKAHVWDWQAHAPGTGRCAQHALSLVR